MESVSIIRSNITPLLQSNVDTDAIMPKQYLKSTKKEGYGGYLFDEWRYLDTAEWGDDCSTRKRNKSFILNNPLYVESKILLVKENFGCGSSREHAVWGLKDFGFRVIIGLSFASIFYSNSIRNGLLLIKISEAQLEDIESVLKERPEEEAVIDLNRQDIQISDISISFDIGEDEKSRLINGLDDIDITSKFFEDIREYESKRRLKEPWIFADI